MKKLFACFMKDEAGATAIEYGLIARDHHRGSGCRLEAEHDLHQRPDRAQVIAAFSGATRESPDFEPGFFLALPGCVAPQKFPHPNKFGLA
jgi:hypothetical protein